MTTSELLAARRLRAEADLARIAELKARGDALLAKIRERRA